MSEYDNKIIVAPWVGPASCRKTISVIILSLNVGIIDRLSESLQEVHDQGDFRWKLLLVRSIDLEEIIKLTHVTGNVAIDFIVIALDTSKVFCLTWAEKIITQIHPDLRRRRTILVNPTGLPANGMAVMSNDLIFFSSKFNLDLLSANIFNTEDATFLSRRLIKYIEVVVGVRSGIPNINI